MATNAAAMPQPVRKNCRRFRPSRPAFASASSLIRASTLFWVALCGGGRYSPLETIWVGIGVAAEAASAPATRRCSRSLSQLPIGFLRLAGNREGPVVARSRLRARSVTPTMAWTPGYEVRLTEEWEGAASGDRPCWSTGECRRHARRVRLRAAFPPGCLPENWTCRYPGYTLGSLGLVSPLRPLPSRHISYRERQLLVGERRSRALPSRPYCAFCAFSCSSTPTALTS